LENRIRKILEYKWEKINIKTTFKSILENRIRKNMNFEKRFLKTLRAKLEFQGCLKKYGGAEEKISNSIIHLRGPV
jgi:fructose/tagatose bisphosphate aldolase